MEKLTEIFGPRRQEFGEAGRAGPACAPRIGVSEFLDWARLEPFTGHPAASAASEARTAAPRRAVDDVLELVAPPPGRGFNIFAGS